MASLAEFAPAGAKNIKSVFGRGVYLAKNTSRPANVRAAPFAASALPQAAAPSFGEKFSLQMNAVALQRATFPPRRAGVGREL